MDGSAAGRSRRAWPGDAALAPFNGRRGWQFGVLGAVLVVMVFVAYAAYRVMEVREGGGTPPLMDFIVFWGAAKLAAAGNALAAFDTGLLAGSHGVEHESWLPWLYPPGVMLMIEPLGRLGFATAWIIFISVSFVAFAAALRPFVAGLLPAWLAFAFAPAFMPALAMGQMTLLWLAGLLAALAALRADRQVLAGVLIGLLTLKPQLGLLIPVALLAGRFWPAIASATVTTVLVALLPTAIYGVDYWRAMVDMNAEHVEWLVEHAPEMRLMVSPYAGLRWLGLDHQPALWLQWTIAGAAALTVAAAWRNPRASFDLRAGVLAAAIPLATPYLWFYDTAFVALAALFLLRAGVLRPRGIGLGALVMLWMGAGPLILVRLLSGEPLMVRAMTLPFLLLAFALACRGLVRLRRAREAATA